MRILVVSKFYPPVLGGVEVTVKELCEEFVRRGHEVTAVVMTKGSAAEESLNGVRVLRFPVDARWLGGLNRPVQSYLSKELDPGRFDIVHVHYPFFGTAEILACKRLCMHPRLVLQYHFDVVGQSLSAHLAASNCSPACW